MNIAYAFRRECWYPHFGRGTELLPSDVRGKWLGKVKEMGFDGLEIGAGLPDGVDVSEKTVKDLGKEIADAGLTVLGVRGGGSIANPRSGDAARKRWEDAIRFAGWIGSPVMNSIMGTGSDTNAPGHFVGDPVSQGSSELASQSDYDISAEALKGFCDLAAGLGVDISIEVHQHSIFDTSWAARKIVAMVDRPNLSINPDLGNILWTWEIPKETCEDAIVALAPISGKYWHCKNLTRVHIPENRHAIFLQVPLPDGDIDYRFALSAMIDAGFDGTIAVEGIRLGDPYHADARSCAYVRDLISDLA